MTQATVRPFLISTDEEGRVRLTIRETHRNMQGFAWVKSTVHAESFENTAAAKAYARDHLGAKPGEYAKK